MWLLLLGRFTQRKSVLTALAEAPKQRQLIPIIFDFPPPEQSDLIETVMLLAGMSALVIVEITSPRSTPMELQAIASNYGVTVVPVMKQGAKEFDAFSGLRNFPSLGVTACTALASAGRVDESHQLCRREDC